MQKYPNRGKVTKNMSDTGKEDKRNSSDIVGISPIYQTSELLVNGVSHESGVFHFHVSSSLDYGVCPYCGHVSHRVHSRYVRVVQDLPVLGEQVILYLKVRKFFCPNDDCAKNTFAEQPGNEIFRYRRRTCRCERMVARQGISVPSGMASRLLSRIGIGISGSTVLRDIHRIRPSDHEDVTKIGVDDWAWRKGVAYGSIIIDYTEGRPIDLLEDREAGGFLQWLEKHGRVCVVSRDRSTDYSGAVASTKRRITEVADKFHLVKNIMDRLAGLIADNYADYRKSIRDMEETGIETGEESDVPVGRERPVKKPDLREIKFREVKELQQKGFRPFRISKLLGISRPTATKYCKMDFLPDRNSKLRNEYYKYDAYVEREAGSGKALLLIYKEICDMGFSGSLTPFYDRYRYLSDGHRGYRVKKWKPDPERKKPVDDRSELLPVKSILSVVNKILKRQNVDGTQQKTFDALMSLDWFKEMYEAVRMFREVINGNETVCLIRWMKLYWKTSVSPLKTFITGIKKDFEAVRNTIKYNLTNGLTEGFVNKLKVIKRSMYGRAGLGLLKNKLVLEHILFN